ncbi:MAG TPA: EAL domain-containing response regulator [Xanthobacteraceae bacterium]|jgi:EAL domain-containing protein (putative c-di-GMP-specific phosphodiesterase class I)/FixJ family two-component response regulator|nr:EAL domain-containing response regulator [Xanthobacteraceae bacterium]
MSDPQPAETRPTAAGQLAYVLDDEPQVRAIVGKILLSIGFEPQPFATPAMLFADLKKASPELIVLDLALGQSDAIEVIRHLETFHYQGKVMLISGRDLSTLAEIQRIGEQHGLTMLPPVQKPFRVAEIKASLAAVAAGVQAAPPPAKSEAPEEDDVKQVKIDPDEALRKCWLRLWYQAKIDLKSMTVCGAEALLRARHPDHGIVSPANFLPAGRSGLYQPLTKFVVLQAMADWDTFAEQGQLLKLSINVPLATLHSPAIVELIRNSLPRKPHFPGLIVEVTEGDMLLDPSGIREVATQLKLYDVALSIDNFGGAHSPLTRLRDLPCVELKLDRSYVSGCATDGAKQAVCSAAIQLAHGFGLTVCAKGVENVDDLRTLIELGCHTAQGFLFSRPMDSLSFIRMLRGRSAGSKPNGGDAVGMKLRA